MARHKITCITKKDRFNTHEHITHLGSSSEQRYWTRDQVIALINSGDTFYVQTGAHHAEIDIYHPKDGRHPFLRTHADGYWNDNLLSLSECA